MPQQNSQYKVAENESNYLNAKIVLYFSIGSLVTIVLGLLYLLNFNKRIDRIESTFDRLYEAIDKIRIVSGKESLNYSENPKITYSNSDGVRKNNQTKNVSFSNVLNISFEKDLSDTTQIGFSGGTNKFTYFLRQIEFGTELSRSSIEEINIFLPIRIINRKNIFISLGVHDLKDKLIANIDSNRIFKNKDYPGKIFSDSKGMEIIDDLNHVAFSVNIQSTTIFVQGYYLNTQENNLVIIGNKLFDKIPLSSPQSKINETFILCGVTRLFNDHGIRIKTLEKVQ